MNRNGACKVSDFGVSELADAQGFRKASGGTIGYMPPEQMNGHELDERTDEFALAAVTYEILTGKRPFAARSLDASAKLIQKFDIAPASSLRTDLDPGIDSVLFTALSPDPDDRYDSVEEFLAALMPYLGNPRARQPPPAGNRPGGRRGRGGGKLRPSQTKHPRSRLAASQPCPRSRHRRRALLVAQHFGPIQRHDARYQRRHARRVASGSRRGSQTPLWCPGLAMLVNGASLFLCSVPMPALGIAAIAAAAGWVILFGREGVADTNCALIISPLGLVGFAPLAPMIAGYCLPPVRALGAAVIQVILMLTVGRNTGPELLFGSITSIPTWIMICAWIVSAVLMSLLCSRETRILSILGAVCAACVLLVAQGIGMWVLTGIFTGPSGTWTITTVLACVAMCVVGVLRSSVRHKGE